MKLKRLKTGHWQIESDNYKAIGSYNAIRQSALEKCYIPVEEFDFAIQDMHENCNDLAIFGELKGAYIYSKVENEETAFLN